MSVSYLFPVPCSLFPSFVNNRLGKSQPKSKLTQNQIMSTTKNQVQSLLQQLPDDCSIEDIQYHLYVIEKVRRGLEVADREGTISQVAVEERLNKWLIK